MIQSRSADSIVREAGRLAQDPSFHGTITDMGGPTANLYGADCPRWAKKGFCRNKRCMAPEICPRLDPGYEKSLPLYRRIRQIPGVNHAFIGSGFRHDLFGGGSGSDTCLEELCRFHVSGRMKVAPEHVSGPVLDAMGKPRMAVYDAFVKQFNRINKHLPSRRHLINYFISAHPGSTLKDALELAIYLINRGMHPEQVQDFIPLPLTMSGAMYHTEKHPVTGERIYVAKTFRERKMQRALVQYRNTANRKLIREALKELKAEHLTARFFKAAAEKPPKRSTVSGRSKTDGTGSKARPARKPGGRRAEKTGKKARGKRRC
jgi:uncharacterized radical SAM protein YgiQ